MWGCFTGEHQQQGDDWRTHLDLNSCEQTIKKKCFCLFHLNSTTRFLHSQVFLFRLEINWFPLSLRANNQAVTSLCCQSGGLYRGAPLLHHCSVSEALPVTNTLPIISCLIGPMEPVSGMWTTSCCGLFRRVLDLKQDAFLPVIISGFYAHLICSGHPGFLRCDVFCGSDVPDTGMSWRGDAPGWRNWEQEAARHS